MTNWPGLATYLQGTTAGSVSSIPEDVLASYAAADLDDDDLADGLLEQGIEMCDNCGTWVESGEIVRDDAGDNPIGCDGCV